MNEEELNCSHVTIGLLSEPASLKTDLLFAFIRAPSSNGALKRMNEEQSKIIPICNFPVFVEIISLDSPTGGVGSASEDSLDVLYSSVDIFLVAFSLTDLASFHTIGQSLLPNARKLAPANTAPFVVTGINPYVLERANVMLNEADASNGLNNSSVKNKISQSGSSNNSVVDTELDIDKIPGQEEVVDSVLPIALCTNFGGSFIRQLGNKNSVPNFVDFAFESTVKLAMKHKLQSSKRDYDRAQKFYPHLVKSLFNNNSGNAPPPPELTFNL